MCIRDSNQLIVCIKLSPLEFKTETNFWKRFSLLFTTIVKLEPQAFVGSVFRTWWSITFLFTYSPFDLFAHCLYAFQLWSLFIWCPYETRDYYLFVSTNHLYRSNFYSLPLLALRSSPHRSSLYLPFHILIGMTTCIINNLFHILESLFSSFPVPFNVCLLYTSRCV